MALKDLVLLALVLFWLVLAVGFMIKRKKDGKCLGCHECDGSQCSGCVGKNGQE